MTDPAVAGRVFENVAMESMSSRWPIYSNNMPFPSKYRRTMTRGRHTDVVPDGVTLSVGPKVVGSARAIEVDGDTWAEIKGIKRKSIPKSYNKYQLAGMIDVLAGRGKKGKKSRKLGPVLAIVTTADSKIGPSLKKYAKQRGVNLLHFVAQEDDNGNIYIGGDVTINRSGLSITLPGAKINPDSIDVNKSRNTLK